MQREQEVYRHAEWKKNSIKKQKNRRADKKRRRSKYVYRKFESISLHFFFSLLSCAARRLCLCNLIRVYFLLIELYSLFHPSSARCPHLPQKGFQLHLRAAAFTVRAAVRVAGRRGDGDRHERHALGMSRGLPT
jgi:hypothetical protein